MAERWHCMIISDEGKCCWIYELDMKGNKSLFKLCMKVVMGITGVMAVFLLGLDIFKGSGIKLKTIELLLAIFTAVLVITELAYAYIARKYHDHYAMVYEMDDDGIKFSQIEDQKKITEAVGLFAAAAGALSGNYGMIGSALAAGTDSIYTPFSKVHTITEKRKDNLIEIYWSVMMNIIYVDDEHYDLVLEYIKERCPQAKVK